MCDYTQREYGCGHHRWIASRWCQDYTMTQKRCEPNVIHFEFREHQPCGECRPKTYPPWESMIRRPKNRPKH